MIRVPSNTFQLGVYIMIDIDLIDSTFIKSENNVEMMLWEIIKENRAHNTGEVFRFHNLNFRSSFQNRSRTLIY